MSSVIVLVEGYVRGADSETVQGTVTLVQDAGHNIVVDPGMTEESATILAALQKLGLGPDDIDTVFITHHHPDHTRHMGLFPDAKVIDYESIYDGNQWLGAGDGYEVTPDVQVIYTPGHTSEDATLLVSNVANIPDKVDCTVAICHLWWYEGKDDDPTAEDMEQLRASREKVEGLADFIVPGHGPMFAVPEKD